ncbi:MAG: 50S ribosomal protein L25 [Saprospiraceae bacterium]|nr:50S ribosomal protein L25 [Saprospiraceae bacterium]
MEIVAVNGIERAQTGKASSRQSRREGQIPAVLYGGKEVTHFSVAPNDIKTLIFTPDFKLAEITINGTTSKAILKDYQMHPVTDAVTHIDFLRLIEGVNVKVDIPVRFKGSSPGVKVGGKLQQNVRRVTIKTTPENLVSELMVDVSSLQLGESIRVKDIEPKEGVEIMTSPSIPVGTVIVPRALRSAASAAAKEE